MASLNKVLLIGNLGRDPELKYSQSGKALCTFSMATSSRTAGGEDKTEWHNILLFDRLAETASKFLAKGRQVYIEGRIQTRKYQDKEGVERYRTEIIGQEMKMLGQRPGGGASAGDDYGEPGDYAPAPAPRPAAAARPAPARPVPQDDDPFSDKFDSGPASEDEIPF